MVKIVVASENPVKIEAALRGFVMMFPNWKFSAEGHSVPSGVSAQPMTSLETRQGALNRAENVRTEFPDADYWVGIEGGIEDENGELIVFAWVVVLSANTPQTIGYSRSATFYLPHEIAVLVRQGLELGDADDQVFGRSNSKQQNGSVGILTGDAVTRLGYYEQAMVLALIPFKNEQLTFGASESR